MNATPSGHAGGPEPPVEEGPTPFVRTAVPARDGLLTTGAKRSTIGTAVVRFVAVMLACLIGVLDYLAWAERDDGEAAREDDAAALGVAALTRSVKCVELACHISLLVLSQPGLLEY